MAKTTKSVPARVNVTTTYVKSAIDQLRRAKPASFTAVQERRLRDISVQTEILKNYPVKKLIGLLEANTLRPHMRQRNHARDLEQGRSEHITKALSLSHTELVLCYWNDHWDFVDGNHRAKFWKDYKRGEVPTVVNLVLKFPKTPEQYLALFFEYDSNAAHKDNTDNLEGILNALELLDKLKSPMFLDGAFWGAAWRLAGSRNLEAVYKACDDHQLAFQKLDKHGFRASYLPMGGMLAAVELYHSEEEELVFDFINDFRSAYACGIKMSLSGRPSSPPEVNMLMDRILAYRKEHGLHHAARGYGLTGENAVPFVRDNMMECFELYKTRRIDELMALHNALKAKLKRRRAA